MPVKRSIGEQFDVVCDRLDDLVKNCKGLHDYLKKFLQLEKDYGHGLQKLTKAATGKIQFPGGLGGGWLASVQISSKVGEHRLHELETMQEVALKRLATTFDGGELDRMRKQLVLEGRRFIKEMDQAVQKFQKSKANYRSAAQEWMSVLLALHKEHGDIWAPSATRLRDKETNACKKCNEMKMAYLSEVSSANVVQHAHYFERMPQVLANMYQLGENIVKVVSTTLKNLRQYNEKTMAKELAPSFAALSDWLPLDVDAKQYVADFVACHMPTDNILIPRPHIFEEFLMDDEAAKIHARKVQYEIIKCFPSAAALGMHAKTPPPTPPPPQRNDPSPADVLRDVERSMSTRADEASVSSMLDLRHALIQRGRQLIKTVTGRDDVSLAQNISQPVLQPWPYTFDGDEFPVQSPLPPPLDESDDDDDETPFLIRCCVEYLCKPMALREEGIFRISGDMRRVQQLHAGFLAYETSKGQNRGLRGFLAKEIATELNPNVVAGLLKLHLRERGCLASERAVALARLVQKSERDFCDEVQSVLVAESAQNRAILKSVIGVLKKVEEHSGETKMTTDAIAVSCGLSVFPGMETRSSIRCLKLFLTHFDDIFSIE